MMRLRSFASLTLTAALAQPLPEFDAATIKPVVPGKPHQVGLQTFSDGRIVLPTVTLKSLLVTAFGLSSWQISGAEGWMSSEEYDVTAKVSEEMRPRIKTWRHTWFGLEDPTLRQMLQALLADRFALKSHFESKQGTVYVLTPSGKPLRLVPSPAAPADPDQENKPLPAGNMGYARARWAISNMSLPDIAKFATDFVLYAPVLDQTGLTGAFDFRQSPDTDSTQDAADQTASFLRMVAELGLKIETTKGPVQSLVVDSAQKPSAN